MKLRKKVLAGLLAAAMTAEASCGVRGEEKSGESGGGGSAEQVLNISTNSVVVGLNPLVNTTGPDNKAHNMIYDPLVRIVRQRTIRMRSCRQPLKAGTWWTN